jgi:hypothetical protein
MIRLQTDALCFGGDNGTEARIDWSDGTLRFVAGDMPIDDAAKIFFERVVKRQIDFGISHETRRALEYCKAVIMADQHVPVRKDAERAAYREQALALVDAAIERLALRETEL